MNAEPPEGFPEEDPMSAHYIERKEKFEKELEESRKKHLHK